MDNRYNGWTNYATWRVNLEIFDGINPRDMDWHKLDQYDLKSAIQEYATETVEMGVPDGLALDYARAFLSDVNWWEIANSIIETMADDEEVEECE